MQKLNNALDNYFNGAEPSEIALKSGGLVLLAVGTGYVLLNFQAVKKNTMKRIFSVVKVLPGISGEVQKAKDDVIKSLEKGYKGWGGEKLSKIPEVPYSHQQVLELLKEVAARENANWNTGKISGVVYHGKPEHLKLMTDTYELFALSNPLHPEVFPGTRKFEADIIRMTADMLGSDGSVVGGMTAGGTESILMACKAYRDFYDKAEPEMVLPSSAHAAFTKAGDYFRIKCHIIPVDPKTMKADVKAMERAINSNTILMVGSAPGYPHGIIDDIPALAAVAARKGIGFHTDCCLGGFFLPWAKRLHPKEIPDFDFTIPGVTSISCDTHKYGYTVKGTSVVLFRDPKVRNRMFYVDPNWLGGTYACPTIAGSRPGALNVCCWASLVAIGQKGFMDCAEQIYDAAQKIKKGIQELDGMALIGDSYSSVIAFNSPKYNIFQLSHEMNKRGWHLNNLQNPSGVHICVTVQTVPVVQTFIDDLKDSIETVKKNPKHTDTEAVLYGMVAHLPDRDLITDIAETYVAANLDL